MRVIEVSMVQRRNERVGGNGRSPRKPADQRHRPARFPQPFSDWMRKALGAGLASDWLLHAANGSLLAALLSGERVAALIGVRRYNVSMPDGTRGQFANIVGRDSGSIPDPAVLISEITPGGSWVDPGSLIQDMADFFLVSIIPGHYMKRDPRIERCWNARARETGVSRQAASSSTIPACEDPGVNPPGIEPGWPWWETSALATGPPLPQRDCTHEVQVTWHVNVERDCTQEVQVTGHVNVERDCTQEVQVTGHVNVERDCTHEVQVTWHVNVERICTQEVQVTGHVNVESDCTQEVQVTWHVNVERDCTQEVQVTGHVNVERHCTQEVQVTWHANVERDCTQEVQVTGHVNVERDCTQEVQVTGHVNVERDCTQEVQSFLRELPLSPLLHPSLLIVIMVYNASTADKDALPRGTRPALLSLTPTFRSAYLHAFLERLGARPRVLVSTVSLARFLALNAQVHTPLDIGVLRTDEYEMRRAWNSCEMKEPWEGGGGGREIPTPRKPDDQRHRPARFPHARIQERPGWESNPRKLTVSHGLQSSLENTTSPVKKIISGTCQIPAERFRRTSREHFATQFRGNNTGVCPSLLRSSAEFAETTARRLHSSRVTYCIKQSNESVGVFSNYICRGLLLISDRDFEPLISVVRNELHLDLQSSFELEWGNSFLCRSYIRSRIEFRTTMVQPGIKARSVDHIRLKIKWVPAAVRRVISGVSCFPPPFHSGAAPYSPRFTLNGSQDLARLARRSEGASAARVNVVLIASALPFLKHAENMQVGGALQMDLRSSRCRPAHNKLVTLQTKRQKTPNVWRFEPKYGRTTRSEWLGVVCVNVEVPAHFALCLHRHWPVRRCEMGAAKFICCSSCGERTQWWTSVVASLLASHQGKPDSNPGGVPRDLRTRGSVAVVGHLAVNCCSIFSYLRRHRPHSSDGKECMKSVGDKLHAHNTCIKARGVPLSPRLYADRLNRTRNFPDARLASAQWRKQRAYVTACPRAKCQLFQVADPLRHLRHIGRDQHPSLLRPDTCCRDQHPPAPSPCRLNMRSQTLAGVTLDTQLAEWAAKFNARHALPRFLSHDRKNSSPRNSYTRLQTSASEAPSTFIWRCHRALRQVLDTRRITRVVTTDVGRRVSAKR
ncbi:hypothetical protein PR048_004582 [Dryococelus australis]|uniref:Uncharacterized protein n=1 Tax=Dryococelus australis TaxID=614101 RepID=A0ABQ9I5T9_9NEOP|nr:hypothetical protein PR048_004582 [Dryococelus australis]